MVYLGRKDLLLIEYIILISVWMVSFLLLYLCVPKVMYREAQVSFLFMQALTWFSGGIVVEMHLIRYPVRLFTHAFQSSFTFEYLAFPVISVLFNLYFPENKSWVKKALYVLTFPTILTIIEVPLEKYTDTLEYQHWNWVLIWGTRLIALYISYLYYKWFFKYKVS